MKLLSNIFVMMATVYCYFHADVKLSIIGAATLTYVISYINEVVTYINKNDNVLHKIYVVALIIWIVVIMAISAHAIFRENVNEDGLWRVPINDPLISWCFFPLAVQLIDILFHLFVDDYPKDVLKYEMISETTLKQIKIS